MTGVQTCALPISFSGSLPTLICTNSGFNSSNVSLTHNATTKKIQLTVLSQVLPVELISFQAQNTEGGNLLTWQTATEVNTAYFDIESSTDGKTFQKIAETKAKGKAATYEYIDRHPLSITTYYRLKMNDLDGTSSYSNVVSVSQNRPSKIKIYPNPTRDNITIDLGETEQATIQLMDILGKVILEKDKQSGQVLLDMSSLAAGVYFTEITAKGVSIREKVIKN